MVYLLERTTVYIPLSLWMELLFVTSCTFKSVIFTYGGSWSFLLYPILFYISPPLRRHNSVGVIFTLHLLAMLPLGCQTSFPLLATLNPYLERHHFWKMFSASACLHASVLWSIVPTSGAVLHSSKTPHLTASQLFITGRPCSLVTLTTHS